MSIEQQSNALRDALVNELAHHLGTNSPRVMYAWSRPLPSASGAGIVMFARLRKGSRSEIIEASGRDGDAAYRRLVEQCLASVSDQPPRAEEAPAS